MSLLNDYVAETFKKEKEAKLGQLKEKIKKAEADGKNEKIQEYKAAIESVMETKESDWVQELIEKTKNIKIATHVGKFANPKSKVFIYDKNERTDAGVVTTDNSKVIDDIKCRSSAFMKSAKLMKLRLEDGENVFTHIKENDKETMDEFARWGIPPEKLQKMADDMTNIDNQETDPNISQVYFPVGNDEYHLLSIIPSSSLLETMGVKIRSMDYKKNIARNPKNESYGTPGDFIGEKIRICFGGSKPQNISSLNNQFHGEAELLMSLPPEMMESKDDLPLKNFFNDSVPFKAYIGAIERLHKLFIGKRNNAIIRRKINTNINYIIDAVIETVYRMRQNRPGWTDKDMFTNLPVIQKILIDNKYKDKRDEEWIQLISSDFTRWFFKKYKQIKKEKAVTYGEEEFDHVKKEFESVIREEVNHS